MQGGAFFGAVGFLQVGLSGNMYVFLPAVHNQTLVNTSATLRVVFKQLGIAQGVVLALVVVVVKQLFQPFLALFVVLVVVEVKPLLQLFLVLLDKLEIPHLVVVQRVKLHL